MKSKNWIILLYSAISLITFATLTNIAVDVSTDAYGVMIGIVLMICAIPLHKFGEEYSFLYTLSFAVNTIANCFSVSAYYLTKKISINALDLIYASVPSIIILTILCLLLVLFKQRKKPIVFTILTINILLILASIFFWVTKKSVIYSFGFFSLLIALSYIAVFALNEERFNVFQSISFCSFGCFIIITIVVMVLLSEGEILSGFDGDLGLTSKKKVKLKK